MRYKLYGNGFGKCCLMNRKKIKILIKDWKLGFKMELGMFWMLCLSKRFVVFV